MMQVAQSDHLLSTSLNAHITGKRLSPDTNSTECVAVVVHGQKAVVYTPEEYSSIRPQSVLGCGSMTQVSGCSGTYQVRE